MYYFIILKKIYNSVVYGAILPWRLRCGVQKVLLSPFFIYRKVIMTGKLYKAYIVLDGFFNDWVIL